MQNKARGVVARKKGSPVEVIDMLVPVPGPGEVLVEVQACGPAPPTSSTAKAGSVPSSRTCPDMKQQESSRTWEPALRTSLRGLRRAELARRVGQGRACHRGRLPERDSPALVELNQQGRLDLDVAERITLHEVEVACDRMPSGEVMCPPVAL